MRILQLAQFYPPHLGGEERHIRNLAHALADRGHDVAVATLTAKEDAGTQQEGDVVVHRIAGLAQRVRVLYSNPDERHAPPVPDPSVVRALRQLERGWRPDVVHAHNWMVASRLVPGPHAAPLVMTMHNYGLICATHRLMYEGRRCAGPGLVKCARCALSHYGPAGPLVAGANTAMRPLKRRRIGHFLSVSSAVAQAVAGATGDVPLTVVPNFIPDELGSTSPAERPIFAPEGPYIVYVGDLSREKGVDVLIEAHGQLVHAPSLLVIGRPVDIPAVSSDRVRVIPGAAHEHVLAAFAHATIAVVPSVWPDPCPTTVLEAMAMGAPVIGAASGGIVDMIDDGRSGLLVAPGDVRALTDALARLLADGALREKLRAHGRSDVDRFRIGSVVPRITSIYERVIAAEG